MLQQLLFSCQHMFRRQARTQLQIGHLYMRPPKQHIRGRMYLTIREGLHRLHLHPTYRRLCHKLLQNENLRQLLHLCEQLMRKLNRRHQPMSTGSKQNM